VSGTAKEKREIKKRKKDSRPGGKVAICSFVCVGRGHRARPQKKTRYRRPGGRKEGTGGGGVPSSRSHARKKTVPPARPKKKHRTLTSDSKGKKEKKGRGLRPGTGPAVEQGPSQAGCSAPSGPEKKKEEMTLKWLVQDEGKRKTRASNRLRHVRGNNNTSSTCIVSFWEKKKKGRTDGIRSAP